MDEQAKGSASWVIGQIAWIASVTWFTLVAVKALRVAHMNEETAIAILGSSEVVGVAFFILVSLMPAILFFGAMSVLQWTSYAFAYRSLRQRAVGFCIWLLFLGVSVFISPWFYPLMIILLPLSVVPYWLWRWWLDRRTSPEPIEPEPAFIVETVEVLAALEHESAEAVKAGEFTDAASKRVGKLRERASAAIAESRTHLAMSEAVTTKLAAKLRRSRELTWLMVIIGLFLNIALALIPLLSSTPWRPAERLTLENGRSQIGYVVGEGDWTTILIENPRQIQRIKSSTITVRSVCDVHSKSAAWTRSIADLITSTQVPTYPRCEPNRR